MVLIAPTWCEWQFCRGNGSVCGDQVSLGPTGVSCNRACVLCHLSKIQKILRHMQPPWLHIGLANLCCHFIDLSPAVTA